MDRGQSSSSSSSSTLYRSVVSPLTAIDKFLSSQSQYYLYDHDHQQPQNNANQNQELISSNGLCCFSSISVDSIREERGLQESNFDKFLSSQSQYYLYDHDHQQPQNNANQNQELISSNGLCCFSSISVDSIREERSLQESNFDDQLFLDEEDLNYCLQERNPLTFLQEEVKKDGESIIKRSQKRAKKGSSAKLIKGQWTDDEDSKLIMLVKQLGERKWAQISEKMVGRAGKQCRERWHNHLRPDIKKDRWSEEEERKLVEAHEEVGNKWAEIATRIPGRTENTIKNHWNATKRRQNSRRNKKKHITTTTSNHNPKFHSSSILENYIRTKHINLTNNNSICTTIPTQTSLSNTTPTSSTLTDQDPFSNDHYNYMTFFMEPNYYYSGILLSDSSSLSFDDEFLFMQNHFATSNQSTPPQLVDDSIFLCNQELVVDHNTFGSSTNLNPNKFNFPSAYEYQNSNTHVYSDIYLSHLLNVADSSRSSVSDQYSNFSVGADQFSDGKREMDLIEMVTSNSFLFPQT